MVVFHFPLSVMVRNEVPAGAAPYRDLVSTLMAHKRHIKHVLTGHYHRCGCCVALCCATTGVDVQHMHVEPPCM